MNLSRTCDDAALRRLLAADDEDAALEQHLENCSRCQARLSEMAAEANQWQETKELLTTGGEFSMEVRERPWSDALEVNGASEAKPAWTEAMARQLLAPPSHPEMLGRLGR